MTETSILELKKFHTRVVIDGAQIGQSGLLRKYHSKKLSEKYSSEPAESQTSNTLASTPINGTNRILAMIKSKMGSGPSAVLSSSSIAGAGMREMEPNIQSATKFTDNNSNPKPSRSFTSGGMNPQSLKSFRPKVSNHVAHPGIGAASNTDHLSFLYNTQSVSKQTASKHLKSMKTECSTASQGKNHHTSTEELPPVLDHHDSTYLGRGEGRDTPHRMMSRINWLINLRNIYDKLKCEQGLVFKGAFLSKLKAMSASSQLVGAKEYRSSKSEVGLSLASIEKRILNISRNELTEDLLIGAVMQNNSQSPKYQEKELLGKESPHKDARLRTSSSESSKHRGDWEDSKRQVSTLYYEDNSGSSQKLLDGQAELRRRLRIEESPSNEGPLGGRAVQRTEHNGLVTNNGSSSNRYFEKPRSSSKSDVETARFNKVDGLMSSRNYENSSRPMSSRRARRIPKLNEQKPNFPGMYVGTSSEIIDKDGVHRSLLEQNLNSENIHKHLGDLVNRKASRLVDHSSKHTLEAKQNLHQSKSHAFEPTAPKCRSSSPKENLHHQTIRSTSGAQLGLLGTFSTIRPTELLDQGNTSTNKQQQYLLRELGGSQHIHDHHTVSGNRLAKDVDYLHLHQTGGPESFEFTQVESRNTSLNKPSTTSQLLPNHPRTKDRFSKVVQVDPSSQNDSLEGKSHRSQRIAYEMAPVDNKSSMIDHEARQYQPSLGEHEGQTHHSSKVPSLSKDSQDKVASTSALRRGTPPAGWTHKTDRPQGNIVGQKKTYLTQENKPLRNGDSVEEVSKIPSRHNSKKSVRSHESGGTSRVSKSKERTKKVIQVITSLLESLNRPYEQNQANVHEKLLLEALNSLHIFEFKNVCVLGLDVKNCGDLNSISEGKLLNSYSFRELILQIGILRVLNTPLTPKLLQTISHPNIIVLSLNKCGLTSLGCLSSFDNLNLLNVNDNSIKSLAGLSKCGSLNELYANNNQISSLQDIKHLKQLRILSLAHNLVTDPSEFQYLRRAGTAIQMIRVIHNPVCVAPGFQASLGNILPKTKVITQSFQEHALGDPAMLEVRFGLPRMRVTSRTSAYCGGQVLTLFLTISR